jgi:4'-phosphopantetheinyl transferase
LVRAAIDRTDNELGQDYQILTDPNGKPFMQLPSGESGPSISISHSGDMIVAAATIVGSVGVDIEYHRPNRPFDSIASYAFGPNEKLAAVQSPQAFYRIWCIREALSKASGNGLREVTDRTDRVSGIPDSGVWETQINARKWLLAHILPTDDYSLAIAIACDYPKRCVEWTESSLDIFHP